MDVYVMHAKENLFYTMAAIITVTGFRSVTTAIRSLLSDLPTYKIINYTDVCTQLNTTKNSKGLTPRWRFSSHFMAKKICQDKTSAV